MVKNAAAKSPYENEKKLNSAAARTSTSQSQQYRNYSVDDIILSLANAYDQDEMAWVLYQWQGNSPWGGRC